MSVSYFCLFNDAHQLFLFGHVIILIYSAPSLVLAAANVNFPISSDN